MVYIQELYLRGNVFASSFPRNGVHVTIIHLKISRRINVLKFSRASFHVCLVKNQRLRDLLRLHRQG
jgi:hypothetical protein